MSQYKNGMSMLTNSVVLFAIGLMVTLIIIVVLSNGISGQADNGIQMLVTN